MTLPTLNGFTKKVSDLLDRPNTQMTSAELKAWFDSAPEELRVFLNSSLSKIDTDFALKSEINGVVLGQILNGSLTPAKLSFNAETVEGSQAKANAAETNAKNASVLLTQKGVASGVASLNSSGQVAQIATDALAVNGRRIGNSIPGSNSLAYYNTTMSQQVTTPTRFARATANIGGGYRVFFRLRSNSSSYTAYGQVYVNGSPVGSVFSTSSGVTYDCTQDVTGVADGSEIAIYAWASGSWVYIEYFSLSVGFNDGFAVSGITPN